MGPKLAAAGDVEQRAGDVRSLVRGEPDNSARDLLGLARALQRRQGPDALHAPRIAARQMDLRADDARPHAVHADAFGADFLGEPDGERVDRALRSRVVDVFAGAADA